MAVGDYNNDGYDDIFVTALGQSHLFRNNGNGTSADVTRQAGLWGPNEFSTSAAWVDYDRDVRSWFRIPSTGWTRPLP
ncbi:MAG: FG-GAP repeat domain-containing protein [Candidatus Acidiferrales bacterium]